MTSRLSPLPSAPARRRNRARPRGERKRPRGGNGSSTSPPAMVTGGEYARRTNRSPRVRASGTSTRTRAKAPPPGSSAARKTRGLRASRRSGRRGERNPGHRLRGAVVAADARAMPQRRRPRQERDRGVEPARRIEAAARGQGVAAPELVDVDAVQVHGDAPAGSGRCPRPAVHLHAADLDPPAGRQYVQLHLGPDLPRHQRAGNDGAGPSDRKRAVDRQPHRPLRRARRRRRHRGQGASQRFQTGSASGRNRHYRRVLEPRPGQQLLRFQPHELHHLGVDQIALGQRHPRPGRLAAGGRCRSARGSGASRTRRPPPPAARRRCRSRRQSCCARTARGRARPRRRWSCRPAGNGRSRDRS